MMEAAERELVRSSMRHIVATTRPVDFAQVLADNGWDDVLADDPEIAVGLLGEQIGRGLSPAPLLDLVLQHGAGCGIDPTTAVLLPSMRRGGEVLSGTVAGTDLVVNGLLLGGDERATRVLVASRSGVFEIARAALAPTPSAPHDPDLGLSTVVGRAQLSEPIAPLLAWVGAVSWGRRAISAILIGSASQMLDDTLVYVLQRHQYNRSIASFQTVKHRLADVHVAIMAARAGVATAWSDRTDLSAMAAVVLAARAQHLAATHCQQVHGGIAFTVEHGFHRFIRRGQIVSGLLGHPDDLVRSIGRRLVTDGNVPRTPQLT